MRHLLANVATYMIAGLLFGGAALFGWVRSAQVAITDEETTFASFAPDTISGFRWREVGSGAYERNCQSCHGRNGQGWDKYPPIDSVSALLEAPGGREFILDLHLYGLASRERGVPMPPMGHMTDVELAAVINHVLNSFGNERNSVADGELYMPAEIAARRGLRLSPREVSDSRPGG